MSQEFFDFAFRAKVRDDDFIVSESNSAALAAIEEWPNWKAHAIFIYGPQNSGKTMLSNIWAKASRASTLMPNDIYRLVGGQTGYFGGAYIIEDVERVYDEAALLHFFNSVKEDGGYVMLTARNHPTNLKIRLPDLRSRINILPCYSVNNPDDELLRTLFFKHFFDHQLKIEMHVVDYLVARTERSFSAVRMLVEEIDKNALQEKKNITIPFVKSVIEKMQYTVQ